MRRVKIILAVVAAVATMSLVASPAMAQTSLFVPNADCSNSVCFTGTSSGVGDLDDVAFLGDGRFGFGIVGDEDDLYRLFVPAFVLAEDTDVFGPVFLVFDD